MARGDRIRVDLVLSRRQLKALLFLALLAGGAYALMSETFTLVTYYPAPSGVYDQLITTGATYLDRDMAGNVGVGTTSPGALLDVNGNVIAKDPTAANHLATKAYVDANAGGGTKSWFRTSATAQGTADALALCTNAGPYHMCYPGEWVGWSWDKTKGDTSPTWNTAAWVDTHTNSYQGSGADCQTWNPSSVSPPASYWTSCTGTIWGISPPQACQWAGCGTAVVLSRQLSNDITQFAIQETNQYTNNCYYGGYLYGNPNVYPYSYICYKPIIINPNNPSGNTASYPLQCCGASLPAMCCHN